MSATGYCLDPIFFEHKTGNHPEHSSRLEIIRTLIESCLMWFDLKEFKPTLATLEELSLVHTASLIEHIASTEGMALSVIDEDTLTSPRSYEVARFAVGGLLRLVDAVMNGECKNAFAFVRPPGHHAEPDRAMGFCLFSNAAIAARYAIEKYHLNRILILDWDVHHGNGTQKAFWNVPEVLYFSLHQFPFYPGTGNFDEVGAGEGKGFTVNVPLPSGCGDDEYLLIFERILLPILFRFHPDLILVSAGFDAHKLDPLAHMQVSAEGFGQMTRILLNAADTLCLGRVVMVLEGGYSLEGLKTSIHAVLEGMQGIFPQGKTTLNIHPTIAQVINGVKRYQKSFWLDL